MNCQKVSYRFLFQGPPHSHRPAHRHLLPTPPQPYSEPGTSASCAHSSTSLLHFLGPPTQEIQCAHRLNFLNYWT